ncbi:MAG: replication-relaxation family protein [Paludibacterium sp.]|uniref:helix-turn-helix transcriptional regulator n=1 Tax=Paludibacterium sp. TaxID=1917523 RepID=UPI0025D11AE1|nr:DeoR family transcriptional regulator [Paludibacterium sp.]MBV8048068.1 replication-relaxation family protein [Paludibacterium sp.]MBV8646951.1 replication-relaxation family protein [Paludibacterium sp.]
MDKSSRPEEQLLLWIKTHDACSTANLAQAFGTTTEAVRQQMVKLVEQGMVEGEVSRKGVGRPKQLWHLTPAGHARFPDTHAQLTLQIIDSIDALFGQDGMARLITHRGAQQLAHYRQALADADSLAQRTQRLAELRSAEGYMARVEHDGGDWLFIEDHCPICAAASTCQRFCASELEQFQSLMEGWAQVSRVEHLLSDGRRCVYRLSPVLGTD